MLLDPEEVQMKSRIWLEENEDFLKEQEGGYLRTYVRVLEYFCHLLLFYRKEAETRSCSCCSRGKEKGKSDYTCVCITAGIKYVSLAEL